MYKEPIQSISLAEPWDKSKTILMTIDSHGDQLSRRAAPRMPRDRALLLVPGSIGNSTMWVPDVQAACVSGAMPVISSEDNAAATTESKTTTKNNNKDTIFV